MTSRISNAPDEEERAERREWLLFLHGMTTRRRTRRPRPLMPAGPRPTPTTSGIDPPVPAGDPERRPRRGLVAAAVAWGVVYACYRGYYAAGGEVGMFGNPVSGARFRAINAVGAVVILLAAVVPVAAVRLPPLRRALPALGWVGAVGCCMHAVVDGLLRVLSLAGRHPTQLPANVWRSFDRHAADLQDLLLNEPWFFVEGLLWGALGIALVRPPRRRAWLATVVAGCLLLAVVGVLSGLDVIGSFRFG